MDNYHDVLQQMEQFGVVWRTTDLPLKIDHPKRKTCGKGGKWWYWLRTFRTDAGESKIVGRYGCYRDDSSEKVIVDWGSSSAEERARRKAEHEAAVIKARAESEREAAEAALTASEMWRHASRTGSSPYLERKGVEGEACRFLHDGSLVIPLLRYDLPRETAVRALQRIWPAPRWHRRTGEPLPQKTFTKGFAKIGCALRLGQVEESTWLVLVCEGYATGLSIRMGTARAYPVYVSLDAYNLVHVVPLLRDLHPDARLLICADDDWQTADHRGPNPGRRAAKTVAKHVTGCDLVWPVFDPVTRQPKDTDFNDLHLRQGLGTVERQLATVIAAVDARIGAHG